MTALARRPTGVGLRALPRESGIAVVVVLLFAGLALGSASFRTGTNLRAVLLDLSLLVVLALGQTLVMVTRNIDLSVGSVLGLSAISTGLLCRSHPGVSLVTVILVGVAIGGAVGLFNGLVIARLQISSIIFTLGMLAIVRGIVYAVGGHTTVTAADLPESVSHLTSSFVLGIPRINAIGLVLAAIVAFVLYATRTGRAIYAVGSNPVAARLHGLSVSRITILVFAASGMFAGLAGVLFLGRFGFSDFNAGTGYELTVIAAVVIGGVSISGGEGSIVGVLLGCVLLGLVGNGFAVIGLSSFWQQVVTGALILAAVMVDAQLQRRSNRMVI